MLKEAIEERQTDKPKEKAIEVEIDLQVDAYLPQDYITDGRQKIDMYKRFRAITSLLELEELQEEMVDRFGEYPVEVDYLFQIAKIKVFAIQERVELIKQEKNVITMLIEEEASNKIDGHRLFELCNKYSRMVGLGMEGGRLKISIATKGLTVEKWLVIINELLNGLSQVKKEGIPLN
jgi:transcription-repair coupling factor (superfamily II helicase)